MIYRWPALLGLAAALLGTCFTAGAAAIPAPPNLVVIDEHLTTSGQPPLSWLENSGAAGYEAVVYLAPATVQDAVKEEPLVLSRQGLVFVNIPIRWETPTVRDYETFAGVLRALGNRKVLVHCQLNYRASTLVFLFRVVERRESPAAAYEAVSGVWSPTDGWKQLIADVLTRNGIAFTPF